MNLDQADDMDYWMDEDINLFHMSFIVLTMDYDDFDGTGAINFCNECLDKVKEELHKIGCQMVGEECSIAKD